MFVAASPSARIVTRFMDQQEHRREPASQGEQRSSHLPFVSPRTVLFAPSVSRASLVARRCLLELDPNRAGALLEALPNARILTTAGFRLLALIR